MAVPKRKNDISVYTGNQLVDRRQELLDRITKSDTNLPESIMHDDLDLGMLEFWGCLGFGGLRGCLGFGDLKHVLGTPWNLGHILVHLLGHLLFVL